MSRSSSVHFLRDSDGACTVPIHTEASYLILSLEARGIVLAVDGAGTLVARPRHLLTEDDRHAIRRLRPHVLRALAYQAPGVH